MRSSNFFAYPDSTPALELPGMLLLPLWDEARWLHLFEYTELRRFRAGDEVIREGAIDRSLCIVMSGSLEVLVPAESNQWTVVAQVGTGSVIGEMAFVDGLPRSATVRATSDGELQRLSDHAFTNFALHDVDLARNLLLDIARILALRLRHTTRVRSAR